MIGVAQLDCLLGLYDTALIHRNPCGWSGGKTSQDRLTYCKMELNKSWKSIGTCSWAQKATEWGALMTERSRQEIWREREKACYPGSINKLDEHENKVTKACHSTYQSGLIWKTPRESLQIWWRQTCLAQMLAVQNFMPLTRSMSKVYSPQHWWPDHSSKGKLSVLQLLEWGQEDTLWITAGANNSAQSWRIECGVHNTTISCFTKTILSRLPSLQPLIQKKLFSWARLFKERITLSTG